ncbi:MAG: efflux RND transporter periplasmic adaptor subunit [Pseudomonadota bacterium]
MRLVPVLTALCVAVALYFLVLDRESLNTFVSRFQGTGEATAAVPEADAEQLQTAAAAADDGGTDEPLVSVVALRSVAQDVQSGILLRGRTEAGRKVSVTAETNGLVVSEPLEKGALVRAGDLMCALDAGTRPAELQQALASLEEARANANAANTLFRRGVGSETQALAETARLEGALAIVEQAKRELERLDIHAPFDGLLESDTAQLGTLLQPGTTCGTVLDLRRIKLVGFVAERDINKVEIGAPAGARLSSGQMVEGEVSFVSRSADPLTRTFQVEVEVDNADLGIRDGMTAEINISLPGVQAHLLPQASLTLDDGGQLGVRVVEDGVALFKPVTVIRDDARGLWISGLAPQAEVIVVGQEFVNDGRAVQVTFAETMQ